MVNANVDAMGDLRENALGSRSGYVSYPMKSTQKSDIMNFRNSLEPTIQMAVRAICEFT